MKNFKATTKLPNTYKEDIKQAVDIMNRGGIILYPTDTIWGLGCDATNTKAVNRIYEIKKRADSKALISLVDTESKVQFYVRNIPEIVWDILELSTKPTTIVYDEVRNLAHNLLAEDGTAAIRITKEPFSKELCFRMKRAIVSTSANISGEKSPQNFNEISQQILDSVDYICRSRQNEKNNPPASSIIKITKDSIVKVIRE